MESEFVPVSRRVTIQDGVYQQLRHALMVGRFDPGQTLTIASLADSFGTSHMPVREALRRLAAENALEIAPNGSARVPAISKVRLDDLCRARIAIEGLAAELAVPNTGDADVNALEDLVKAHETSSHEESIYTMLVKKQEFHFTLYQRSGSEVLLQLAESLWLRFGPYMRMLTRHLEPTLRSREGETYTRHHHDAIAALRRRDGAGVRQAISEDINATQTLLRPLCD
ncbi:GntR family transcriptional regulator [Nitratireductor rhodophyticola]|uniref:GntR family transcriptional regulator n=1 Tax=Nitratireductor rhodophyticola TaxID=2854036 RepID=UPI002AC971C7|nr:GntR family transcriptional regulator [Nitratireductor rhodophyticola]WPZ12527.1 GntR family transcriptional regulator [Nitratireductor rhodophyticola]